MQLHLFFLLLCVAASSAIDTLLAADPKASKGHSITLWQPRGLSNRQDTFQCLNSQLQPVFPCYTNQQCCPGKSIQNTYRCASKDYTCCPGFDLACPPGRECCGGFCCQQGQVCSSAATCVVRASSTAGVRSATSTRIGTSATGSSTTQVSGGGAEGGAEGDEPKKGFSQSDKIALGCGIGIGLPTLLVAILTLWSKCT